MSRNAMAASRGDSVMVATQFARFLYFAEYSVSTISQDGGLNRQSRMEALAGVVHIYLACAKVSASNGWIAARRGKSAPVADRRQDRWRKRMDTTRRAILTAGGAVLAAAAAAPRAFAQWRMNDRYPDPAVEVLDPSFLKYRLALASVERIATGTRWNEGPVWFGDGRYLLWSDIPNNRIMRWQEETGAVSVFRQPSNNANGNTRDRQGRLVTCEHDARRVTRTEYDGTITVIMDKFDGKP